MWYLPFISSNGKGVFYPVYFQHLNPYFDHVNLYVKPLPTTQAVWSDGLKLEIGARNPLVLVLAVLHKHLA